MSMLKIVVPVTSQIHADTFARALGVEVGRVPTGEGGWALFIGVSPSPLIQEFKNKGYKVAAYWIGSDSAAALHQIAYRKNIDVYDKHICVHGRIQKELEAWGIKSEVVWPCARNESEGLPATKEKLVGVYMPEPSLYLFEECKQIAKENKDLPFIFYGSLFEMKDLPENVKDAGRMSPEETQNITDKISVMLRLVRHDGNPVGGIEMKQRNRHVITNFPYEGFLYANTMEEVNQFLQDPLVHEGDFGPWPSYYRERCSKKEFKKEIERILCESVTS
jgi:hypothetical protein